MVFRHKKQSDILPRFLHDYKVNGVESLAKRDPYNSVPVLMGYYF